MATVQIKNGRRLSENDIQRLTGGGDSILRGVGSWSVHFRNPELAKQVANSLNGYDIGVGKLKASFILDPPKPYILYKDVKQEKFKNYYIDPHNQSEVPIDHKRITLCGVDGKDCDLIARYDQQSGTIYPPSF